MAFNYTFLFILMGSCSIQIPFIFLSSSLEIGGNGTLQEYFNDINLFLKLFILIDIFFTVK